MSPIRTVTIMSLDATDVEEAVSIFTTFIDGVRANDPGTLAYDYFLNDDPTRIWVIEEYADSEAHLAHFAKLDGSRIGRLLEIAKVEEAHYFGQPSDAERALLANFGNIVYHRPLISLETAPA